MSLRSLPSQLLPSGVAPLAAVLLIAVAAPSTTLAAAPQPDAGPAAAAPDAALADLPIAAPPVAAHTRADLEAEAIALADEFGAVPADDSGRLCPHDDLEVRWEAPTGYTHGAFIAPVGPAPTTATEDVNGVVVCGDQTWAYMGFEAARADGSPWTVTAVPYVAEAEQAPAELNLDADVPDPTPAEHGHGHGDGDGHGAPAKPAKPAPAPRERGSVATSAWLAGLGRIEGYAAYEPQSACSPTAKAGTVTLKDTLLAAYPATRNLGIARACHLGGQSEHKEGRAFDWGAYVTRTGERASVEQFLTQLLATDADGNRHALARRMGVMYVIWNGKIWSSYRPGWRTYGGPNPHTDHVHVSLSRAGGAGKTSFFTQGLAAQGVLGKVPPGSAPNAATTLPVSAPRATTPPTATPVLARRPSDAETSAPSGSATGTRDGGTAAAPQPSARPERRGAAAAEQRAAEARAREAADAQRRAASERKQAEEAARRADWERKQAEEAARREAERQRWAAEEQQRREADAERRAELERQKAEDRARRDAEHARRDEEQERRRAEKEARRPSQDAQAASGDGRSTHGDRDDRRGRRGGGGGKHR